MREIEGYKYQNIATAPPVIDHVNHNPNWANEYLGKKNELFEENESKNHVLNESWVNATQDIEINKEPLQHGESVNWTESFFETIDTKNDSQKENNTISNIVNNDPERFHYSEVNIK